MLFTYSALIWLVVSPSLAEVVKLSVVQNPGDKVVQLRHNSLSPDDPNRIGWSTFENNITHSGWSFLEVHTSRHFADQVQAYYAGLMEGVATQELIGMHWNNTIGDYCKGQDDYCDKLAKFLQDNLDYMNLHIDAERYNSPYWHQVGLVLEQAAGLEDGYLDRVSNGPHRNVSLFGLYLIAISGDVEDLEVILNKQTGRKRMLGVGKCSALIKVLEDFSDIYTSQVTWNDYVSMLRIQKHYHLGFHLIPVRGSRQIPGRSMSFSGYPGTLQSGDDFYVISSGLVAMETTIGNGNNSLYSDITPEGIVLEWVRAIVASRLAESGLEWAAIFSRFNSGTYNNQWMVVNYNLFKPGDSHLVDGLLTVVEQIPTLVEYEDTTYKLRNQSYWPSYNIPYFQSVFNLSGNQGSVDKYGDWFTYDKSPRAQIFRRDHTKVKDLPSMLSLMRYNDYTHDPLSRCDCSPPYSAENAVAARSDLNPKDGTYPFGALGHRSHGATDAKITSFTLQKSRQFLAVSGPPHDDVPAFQWSTSDYKDMNHIGHPDLWEFEPVTQSWTIGDE
ncbi:putative phospholipase B-like 2 [Halotydeus destructor]|nr:putative phospholipase B-like 2 [Halotydeus destructor]